MIAAASAGDTKRSRRLKVMEVPVTTSGSIPESILTGPLISWFPSVTTAPKMVVPGGRPVRYTSIDALAAVTETPSTVTSRFTTAIPNIFLEISRPDRSATPTTCPASTGLTVNAIIAARSTTRRFMKGLLSSGGDFREAAGVVDGVPREEPDTRAVLVRDDPPYVHFSFVDPAVAMEGRTGE